jgi:hypothetical protein
MLFADSHGVCIVSYELQLWLLIPTLWEKELPCHPCQNCDWSQWYILVFCSTLPSSDPWFFFFVLRTGCINKRVFEVQTRWCQLCSDCSRVCIRKCSCASSSDLSQSSHFDVGRLSKILMAGNITHAVWSSWNLFPNLDGCCHCPRPDFYINFLFSPSRVYIRSIDHRCEDGRFPVLASCVTISNLGLLSSSETVVNLGIKSWKSSYLIELDVRKPLVVSISQTSEELRLYNPV